MTRNLKTLDNMLSAMSADNERRMQILDSFKNELQIIIDQLEHAVLSNTEILLNVDESIIVGFALCVVRDVKGNNELQTTLEELKCT